jgi:hypothetical protein
VRGEGGSEGDGHLKIWMRGSLTLYLKGNSEEIWCKRAWSDEERCRQTLLNGEGVYYTKSKRVVYACRCVSCSNSCSTRGSISWALMRVSA